MSLKAEIETWAAALELYDAENFDEALAAFEEIADSSKILFNIGLIYATLGEHEVAIENFRTATSLDQYMAVAYFQCGVSNFLLGMYEEAVKDFEDALMYLRGNLTIDYSQLGLKFRLYSCEILFNKGISLIYQGAEDEGMVDLQEARKEKQTTEHSVIDDAIADRAEGYTVFSIPVGVLYRPASSKLKNLASKNYLGQAKLVAATDASETFVGFTGSARAAAKTSTTGPVMSGPMMTSTSSTIPSSSSYNSSDPPGPSGIVRRGTTAARLETTTTTNGGSSRSPPTNIDLRRRPSENTATVTPRLNRSGTASSGSRNGGGSGRLATMAEQREPDDRTNGGGRYGSPRTRANEEYDDRNELTRSSSRAGAPGEDRTTNWARNLSTGSGGGGGSISGRSRNGPHQPSISSTSSAANRRALNRPDSSYDDGNNSDPDYPDTVISSYSEMTKIRVKLHHGSDTRGMAVSIDMEFEDFLGKVIKKFSLRQGSVSMKYKDEEGSMVSIMDVDDWESAIETARAYANGRAEGKVEIWVEDGYL
ncbi:hypothetical protein MJO28_005637 [Puccinia striiformis f. sp. tritici]|uniref:PB1 domain-containing protein n=4 Tax=Puccinia striiformis TaxID=27350 RepID=A0A0L0V5F0_9BASI|nr:hypothetical protein Pst134EA_009765 [Puccinia striiformis f. sp. tritici]KAI9620660.1 hypothetical protein KEM48_008009 [Puccinia striiformis f. sp. tritici PST-130]KNE94244.1 hypothetical protein PSTG_12376 [Puccinia striiformis f. sp. tritici PST-78]POW06280.1 hypothetical protein PSTT_09145 [Puccinia striiformis]KAH9458585.1 hypothetical protein Pst134EB_010882 [Puccinia striiformis f. sp. tritici]KAH9469243.1 hypothetical protein Pst134EA_009765 [Puccinia striiformis f. sp. tritici]